MTCLLPHSRRPVVFRDPGLPHQVVLHFTQVGDHSGYIAVSCNCLRQGQAYTPLEARTRWEASEVLEVYHGHLRSVGTGV